MGTSQITAPELTNTPLVEVFRTNVQAWDVARKIVDDLQHQFPEASINFDLDDCDKILRIADTRIDVEKILSKLAQWGFFCEVLQD